MDLLNSMLQAKVMRVSKWFGQWMKYEGWDCVYDLTWTNLPREEWPVDGKAHEPGVWCSWEMACLLGRGLAEKETLEEK